MFSVIWREDRKHYRWMLRVQICNRWYQVINVFAPSFWAWDEAWKFKRYFLRHLVIRLPGPPHDGTLFG